LVRAFDEIADKRADLRLIIAGPPGWAEDDLTRALGEARHSDRVSRLGWVGPDERATLLRDALVFAYPSIYEGFGLPPLEAMAAGTPVVATAGGAVPEVVGDAALLTPVGDASALAGALAHVVDSIAGRDRLIEAGRLRVAEFTWERCAAGLRQLYVDAIVSGPKQRRRSA
jgi:glycosyltransferase involved in cell wall biosynthesis